MSNTGIPLQSAQNPAPQPDEDMLAMLGLHPAQMAVAHGLASGAIHPQQVLDAATPPPDAAASAPATPALPTSAPPPVLSGQPTTPRIASTAPAASAEPAATPGSTEDLESHALARSTGTPPIATPSPIEARTTTDQTKLAHDTSTGSGIQQFQQRHPILGGIARVGAGVGSALFPNIAAAIPGTDIHHQVVLNQDRKAVGEDLGEQEKTAQVGEAGARQGQMEATTAHENAATDALRNPQPKQEEAGKTITTDEGIFQWNPKTQLYDIRAGAAPKKDEKTTPEQDAYQQSFAALIKQGMTPVQAYEKLREKPENPGEQPGTWQLGEDANGKPILWNSKTGGQRDAGGINKPGTHEKATQAEAGEQQAINYAKDYIDRAVFTGPGDEALQEKFFELAKPKTGFRMSQPQMDMLRNSRSWMTGIEAHIRHATTGTWFSQEQRQQIYSTMQELADARQKTGASAGNPGGGAKTAPKAGDMEQGYKFNGGDPADKNNWEKQ